MSLKSVSLKKIIAPVVIGGVLLGGGIATTGAAYASTPAAATSSTAATGTNSVKAWVKAHRREIRKAGIALSAKTIGVTPADLVSELRSGKSIAQVAAEHNVSSQTVVSALVDGADAKINKAVAANKLSSTLANKIEAALPGYVTKAVNHVFK
jgi:lambda repressor-like predicted transcriptional regulator